MKKVLVCALAALFLMASTVTAFAAGTPVLTTTYTAGSDLVSVSTSVQATADDEMITYLAYVDAEGGTPNSPDDGEIVYIDQQSPVKNASATFTHTFQNNAAYQAAVMATGSNATEKQDIVQNAREVNVAVAGDSTVYNKVYFNTNYTENFEVTTNVRVPAGKEIESVTVDDTAVALEYVSGTDYIKVKDNNAINSGDTITITFKTTAIDPEIDTTVPFKHRAFKPSNPTDGVTEILTVFAAVKTDIDPASAGSDACGIIISTDADRLSESALVSTLSDGSATKFEARALTDGKFAIQILNKDSDEYFTKADTTWYAVVYSRTSAKTVYSAPFAINK